MFAGHEGFRCGTCWEYPVYNFLTRQQLKLKEKPLIVMEDSFFTYQPDLSDVDFVSRVGNLMAKCKKYNGTFVYLWHNSSLRDEDKKALYDKTINLIFEQI